MKRASKTAGAVLGILGVVFVIALISPVKAEDTASQARQLWEKALSAKGGRERLRRVTNIYLAADQGRGDRNWIFTVFPSYQFSFAYDALREVASVEVHNEKKGIAWWQIGNHQASPRTFDETEAFEILEVQYRYLMCTHDLDPVPLRVRKDWLGLKRVNVIETDVKGRQVDYYIDSKTSLPVALEVDHGMRHLMKFDDYAAVDGIMMPHKVRHSFPSSWRPGWTERLKFEINADYNPEIFEQAPTLKTPAEGWRVAKKPATSER